MITLEMISISQLLSLIVVNLTGVLLIGFIFLLNRIIPARPNKKIMLSIGIGLVMQGVLLIAFLDVGIILWIESGNLWDVFSILPFSLCLIPFLLPAVILGTYIQLSYGEKIQSRINSWARNRYIR